MRNDPNRDGPTTKLRFTVDIVVEPDDGEFHAYVPALKGLHVGGATEEEVIQNVTDAVIAYLETSLKHGDPIPVGVMQDPVPVDTSHTPGPHAHRQNLEVSLT